MAWTIEITKTAEKQICSFDKTIQQRIVKFLRALAIADDPRLSGKALKGNKAQLWRYRVGDYRLICNIQDPSIITILEIGHRREIYK